MIYCREVRDRRQYSNEETKFVGNKTAEGFELCVCATQKI